MSLTSAGRSLAGEDELARVKEVLEETLGDEYHVVVADDRVRLLDAEQVKRLLDEPGEYAAQFAHEDAMHDAVMGQAEQEPEDGPD